jgi:hypothetical protein
VSRIDDLIRNYQRFAELPWPRGLAPAQRVWMAVYPPDDERRLRLHLQEFETASTAAGHDWALVTKSARLSRVPPARQGQGDDGAWGCRPLAALS